MINLKPNESGRGYGFAERKIENQLRKLTKVKIDLTSTDK